jgi:hypothetical protein
MSTPTSSDPQPFQRVLAKALWIQQRQAKTACGNLPSGEGRKQELSRSQFSERVFCMLLRILLVGLTILMGWMSYRLFIR